MKDKNEEQKYIESLVTLGKKIALEASQDKELVKKNKNSNIKIHLFGKSEDKELEKRIKKNSNY